MKGISIWWRRAGSVPAGVGDQMAPALSDVLPPPISTFPRLQTSTDRFYIYMYIYIYFFYFFSWGGADSSRARWREAGISWLPFMALFTPRFCSRRKPPRSLQLRLGPFGSTAPWLILGTWTGAKPLNVPAPGLSLALQPVT